ncbi:hypothetical protein LJR220_005901 [Bradyrhizobium sp. LjRoot220]|uniref:hypothetical protein n=1 Tax=Bradyrhizobium sp. LjRoot220 TaxID=3342284 RepID=UPI003ECCA036
MHDKHLPRRQRKGTVRECSDWVLVSWNPKCFSNNKIGGGRHKRGRRLKARGLPDCHVNLAYSERLPRYRILESCRSVGIEVAAIYKNASRRRGIFTKYVETLASNDGTAPGFRQGVANDLKAKLDDA